MSRRRGQQSFAFDQRRRRRRKRPSSGRRKVPHRARAGFSAGAVKVTLRVLPDVRWLRKRLIYRAIRRCMQTTLRRPGFRICHYSIQSNHLHLTCEADSQGDLSRGMQGFASNVARRVNRVTGRRGRFFESRYHHRALTSPTEVRNALAYTINNWRRHGRDREHRDWLTDPFSSGDLFDGWTQPLRGPARPRWLDDGEPVPIASPRSWLLREGWKKVGLISPRFVPGPDADGHRRDLM